MHLIIFFIIEDYYNNTKLRIADIFKEALGQRSVNFWNKIRMYIFSYSKQGVMTTKSNEDIENTFFSL